MSMARWTMETALNCGAHGWTMIAALATTYGVLLLCAAALIKYLFFGNRPTQAAT